MQSTELVAPLAIQTPIAINGDKNIPKQNAQGTDTSSISLGFLPITSEPLDDGGIAPERIDFNGMFYLSTDQRTYLQNGGYITYNVEVATAIGGYPQGAILNYLDSSGNFSQVQSLIDNNQYNFVTTPSYINNTYWKFVSGKPTVISVLEQVYPIGAIFIGTTSSCPMAAIFGTWELVAEDRCLQGSSENHQPNTTIPASLPNVKGGWYLGNGGYYDDHKSTASGAIKVSKGGYGNNGARLSGQGSKFTLDVSANLNSIYSDNTTTVQPSAYVVNVWRRTA
ncbi:hypothetical protein IKE67_09095 [bacterium]|nr:hypothetical protein [bacterium]